MKRKKNLGKNRNNTLNISEQVKTLSSIKDLNEAVPVTERI